MPITILDAEPRLQFSTLSRLPGESVEYLVVHTQGSPGNADGSAAGIHRYHRTPHSQGGPVGGPWAGIGYHFVVRKDGRVERGRPLDRRGAHVHGYNHASIGICCAGNGDLADFTAKQKQSLAALVRDLQGEFPRATVNGHRPLVDQLIGVGTLARRFRTSKTCPGSKVSLPELQQLCGFRPPTPVVGEQRWSRYLNDWIVLKGYASDTEWYFVRASRPNDEPTRARARWSEMPLGPS